MITGHFAIELFHIDINISLYLYESNLVQQFPFIRYLVYSFLWTDPHILFSYLRYRLFLLSCLRYFILFGHLLSHLFLNNVIYVIKLQAVSIGVHPLYLMISATVACSFAFMLPVATPPNAIVFSTGYLRIPDMVSSEVFAITF